MGGSQSVANSGPGSVVRTTSSSGHLVDAQFSALDHTGPRSKKDLEYLIGNLEGFPTSARKLFSMGHLCLVSNWPKTGSDEGFHSLFTPILSQTLPQESTRLEGKDPDECLTTGAEKDDRKRSEVDDRQTVDTQGPVRTESNGPVTAESDSSVKAESGIPVTVESNGAVNGQKHFTVKPQTADPAKPERDLFVPLRTASPFLNMQTYVQWKAVHSLNNFYWLCLPKRTTIYLQPVEDFPQFVKTFRLHTAHLNLNFFETLQGFAQIFFSGLEVYVSPPVTIADMRWKVRHRHHVLTGQKQLCVDDMYPMLQQVLPSDGLCSLGIVWTDIYPEGYNFVLGEASKKHQAAVLSFGRFETKGFDPDHHTDIAEISGPVLWKLLKSMSHEICHLLGLHHCKFFHCAMNESDSVAQAMSQPLFLCPVCLRKLQQACQFDVLERYQQLHKFLTAVLAQFPDSPSFQQAVTWVGRCVDYLGS